MIVMVGTAMLRTASDVPPTASASSYLSTLSGGCGLNVPFGASPGQMRSCSRPAGGCHAPGWLTGGLAADAATSPAGAAATKTWGDALVSASTGKSNMRERIMIHLRRRVWIGRSVTRRKLTNAQLEWRGPLGRGA